MLPTRKMPDTETTNEQLELVVDDSLQGNLFRSYALYHHFILPMDMFSQGPIVLIITVALFYFIYGASFVIIVMNIAEILLT